MTAMPVQSGTPGIGMPGFDWNTWAQGLWGLNPNDNIQVTGAATPPIAGGAVNPIAGAGPLGKPNVGPGALGWANAGVSGLQTLSNLFMGLKQLGLAKKTFQFQRDFSRANLTNSTQAYNTQLEDKINSRYFTQGMSPDQANSYLGSHRLTIPTNLQNRGG